MSLSYFFDFCHHNFKFEQKFKKQVFFFNGGYGDNCNMHTKMHSGKKQNKHYSSVSVRKITKMHSLHSRIFFISNRPPHPQIKKKIIICKKKISKQTRQTPK